MKKEIKETLNRMGYEVAENEVRNAYNRESRKGGICTHSADNITRYLILNEIAKPKQPQQINMVGE